MFCSECGNKIENNARNCPFCGTKIDDIIIEENVSAIQVKDAVDLMEYANNNKVEEKSGVLPLEYNKNEKNSNINKKKIIIIVAILIILIGIIGYFVYQYFAINFGSTNYEKFSNNWVEMLLKLIQPITKIRR